MGFDLLKTQHVISKQQGLPPLDKWDPDFCGDIDMCIKRDGRWFYMGTAIGRQSMVNLFSQVLWKEGDKYFLKTPVEKVGIQVEDAPFLFIDVDVLQEKNGQALKFTSTTGDEIIAGKDFPICVEINPDTQEPAPYLYVRWGMEGLISRNLFYRLVELASLSDDGKELAILSRGEMFSLGTVEPA